MENDKNHLCPVCGRRTANVHCTRCDRPGYNREYYRNNRERLIAAAIEWNKNNPDKRRMYHRRYERRKLEEKV